MRIVLLFAAWSIAAAAGAQQDARRNPLDPKAKVPPVEYRSALGGYRPFAEQELREWRRANEDVKQPAKPQAAGKPPAGGHGAHK